jgi:hypothetical protein
MDNVRMATNRRRFDGAAFLVFAVVDDDEVGNGRRDLAQMSGNGGIGIEGHDNGADLAFSNPRSFGMAIRAMVEKRPEIRAAGYIVALARR